MTDQIYDTNEETNRKDFSVAPGYVVGREMGGVRCRHGEGFSENTLH